MSARANLVVVYCLTIILSSWNNIVVECKAIGEADGDISGTVYLKQFGYLPESTSNGAAQAARDITQSIRAFQRFAGLKQTGRFDNETLERMKAPRCGDKDPIDEYNRRRKRRYLLEGTKWEKKDLTYRIVNDPYEGPTNRQDLTPELISKTFKAALQKWSRAADLTFTELKDGEADIMIHFVAGEHGDDFKFDGRGRTLAHAFYPNTNKGISGDAHFDLDEKFSLIEEDSTNFIWVTTHEFGHSLGLEHSRDVDAIMYPWYTTGKMGNVKLGKDDKHGVQALYGKSRGRKREPLVILPLPPRKECQYSFNVLFSDNMSKKIFAFRGFEFYVLHMNGEESKGPRKVEKRWNGLHTEVRAAYTRKDGYTVFFTRHRYYIYDGRRLVEAAKFIEEYGLTSEQRDMDAVLSMPEHGVTYIFKGEKFWEYDESKRSLVTEGYPKLIKDYWNGLPDNIDGAVHHHDGYSYFFKGLKYYKFNHFQQNVYPGYPKPIGPNWLGCSKMDNGVILKDKSASKRLRFSSVLTFVSVVLWFLCSLVLI